MSEKKIQKHFDKINETLFTINGTLSYTEVLEELEAMCQEIKDTETDEFIWGTMGEGGMACLGDLLVGAYWFLTYYHGGQDSIEYRVFSRIGEIYNPGCVDGPQEESGEEDTYKALEVICPCSDRKEF